MNWVLDRFTEQNPFASVQKGRFHHPFQGGLLSSAALPGAQLLLLWIHPWLSHCHPQTSALILHSPGLQFFISPTAPLLKDSQLYLQPSMLVHIFSNSCTLTTDHHDFEQTLPPTASTACFGKPLKWHQHTLYKVDIFLLPYDHTTAMDSSYFPSRCAFSSHMCYAFKGNSLWRHTLPPSLHTQHEVVKCSLHSHSYPWLIKVSLGIFNFVKIVHN